jgi:hypothetical protein
MRIFLILALCLLGGFLQGMPVLQSALNTNVYHASASAQRCITAYYDPTDLGFALNYVTLWNVENPEYPLAGTTIYEEQYFGPVAYRQPTVYQHYLLYMDEFYLRILDIANVNTPSQVYQMPLAGMYCFTVLDHYLITGHQDGSINSYDITEPQAPVLISSTPSQAAIWMLWPVGNMLAARCGNYTNNTAKLFGFSSGTLSELASVTPSGQISYVGAWNGRLVVQSSSGNILLYEYSSGEDILVADIAASDQTQKIITDGTFLASTGEDNCVRIWQWDPTNGLYIAGYYDLGHLGLDPGILCEMKDGHLLFTLDTVLCLMLDINDLAPDPAFLSTHTDGSPYRSVAIPEHGNTIYCEKNNALHSLKLMPDGRIVPDDNVPAAGVVMSLEGYRDNLYYLAPSDTSYRLKAMNVSDPSAPLAFADLPLTSYEFFGMKGRDIYTGTLSHIEKFVLDPTGLPVWRKQLYYWEPEWNYQVYFYDIVSSGDADYAVGWFGSWMVGYHPIFVYWLPDGTSGAFHLARFYDKVEVAGNHLYLLGWGIRVFRIHTSPVPQYVGEYCANVLNYGVNSSLLVADRYLIANHMLTNSISVYDLQNPEVPQLIHIIHNNHASYDMGRIADKLITTCGTHGISSFNLQGVVENSDAHVPAAPHLAAFPNPFSSRVTIQFEMAKPEPASLEFYNIRGQLVHSQSIMDTRTGINNADWDGRDSSGRQCASGLYIVKLRSSQRSAVIKLTLIRGN